MPELFDVCFRVTSRIGYKWRTRGEIRNRKRMSATQNATLILTSGGWMQQ